jgi:prepilin-type N-terminal cleavage/methylation domain-containing protein
MSTKPNTDNFTQTLHSNHITNISLIFMQDSGMNRQMGFTLAEVLVALLLISIAVAPIIGAFSPSLKASGANEERAVFSNQANRTTSRLAKLDYEALENNQGDPVDLAALFGWPDAPDAAEAAKEDFVLHGQTYSPRVSISDASEGAGDALELRVTIGTLSLLSYRAKY